MGILANGIFRGELVTKVKDELTSARCSIKNILDVKISSFDDSGRLDIDIELYNLDISDKATITIHIDTKSIISNYGKTYDKYLPYEFEISKSYWKVSLSDISAIINTINNEFDTLMSKSRSTDIVQYSDILNVLTTLKNCNVSKVKINDNVFTYKFIGIREGSLLYIVCAVDNDDRSALISVADLTTIDEVICEEEIIEELVEVEDNDVRIIEQ